jgi:hypothetical protein
MERRDFIKTAGVGTLAFTTLGFETACRPVPGPTPGPIPGWVITAEGIAQDIVPIAGTILDIIDPPLAPLVNLAVNGFNAVLKALQDYQNAINNGQPTVTLLQAIQAAFSTLQADAANLLSAFGLSSSHLDAVIAGIINLISQAVSDIANLLPKAMRKVGLSRAFPAPNTWKGSDFTSQYNVLIRGDKRFHAI